MANFLFKNNYLVTMAKRGQSGGNFIHTVQTHDHENLVFGKRLSATVYLTYKPSFCKFCVKIHKFPLPWQQGSGWVNFNNTVKLADLETPQLLQDSQPYLLYKQSYS